MRTKKLLFALAVLMLSTLLPAQKNREADDPDAHPPVTEADLRVIERAQSILTSPAQWDRHDTRKCPADAKTFSLYCTMERATQEVTGGFQHRGAAMQELRFVIDDIAPHVKSYHHRLMDYNNDPATTFADIRKVLQITRDRIAKRLMAERSAHK